MKKIVGILLFGTLSQFAFAQPSSFSKDSVKFLNQVTDYIGEEDKTTAKEFKKKFRNVWSKYSVAEQEAAVNIANGMLAKGTRPFPEFYDFLQSLYGFKITNQPESSYKVWIEMLSKLIQAKDRKQLPDFLKMSGGLFTEGIIFETNAIKWRCRSKDYQFEYDKQPKIVFKSLDLICYAKDDSTTIYNTSGVYSPVSTSWEGKGGKVTWERLLRDDKDAKEKDKGKNRIKYPDLDTAKTYAVLKRYKAMFKTPGFDADSVLFYTPYFKKPLAGELTEKVSGINKTIGIRYPQFNSYSKRLFIKDFYDGADYEGGFTMQGGNVVGSGTTQQLAKLIFYRKDKKFLQVGATNFILNSQDVNTDRSTVTFYIDNDSIYHPGINFKYIVKDNQVTLIRSGNGIVMSPFYDSYHKLEISSEALYWKVDEPVIDFAPLYGSSKTDARFSSYNYFIPAEYDALQGMGTKNPLYPISELALRKDTMILPVADVASYLGYITEEAIPLFYELTTLGLIFYDNESGLITVKPKLKEFTEARAKKRDYDPISFESDLKGPEISTTNRDLKDALAKVNAQIAQVKKDGGSVVNLEQEKEIIEGEIKKLMESLGDRKTSNATLNLSNLDLIIRGVKRVNLSDSQIVRVYPFNQEFVVKKNRDFVFSGVVNAGSTEFFGSNLSYEYAEHKINLPQADSMRLRVFPFGSKGRGSQFRVLSVIKNVRGTIYIDQKDNKSGNRKGNQNYPYLDCIKESYVYYNKKSTYGGVYDSSKFFFKIAPFKMDSLDNFKISGVNFAGDFYSAGILPTMKETLKVQKDYSLGFIRKAPPEGFSLYGDKAKFNNDIRLSDKGLRADGELNYLTSYAQSDDFGLFPDSITGMAQKYENRESLGKAAGQLDVPKITGKDVYVNFVPKQKVFYASTVEASMKTHNDAADYRGKLILRPDGITARGKFFFNNAEMKGKLMKLKSRTIDCDTASFKLKSFDDKNAVALKTENVNAHIDFDQRNGEFKSNGAESFLEFEEIQYICYMDRFKWFMDNDDISLESDKKGADINIESELDLAGSNFFSVHKDQDSLNFMAPKARYDIRKKIIRCEKVEYITVADARVFPDSNKVVLRKNANMDELTNAKIIANYITKYHSIYNAKVKITAKRKYMASGDYTYIDENNFEQKIKFANIYPDSTFQTFAQGEVLEKEKFALSPNFEYKGKVILKAADIGLNFDGYTRIAHKCKDLPKNWFAFKAVIDPKEIVIPITKDLLSDNKRALGSGIYLNLDTTEIYPYAAFLSEKQNPKNPGILTVDGFLVFDKASQEYRVGSLDKLKELSLPGNYISVKKDGCNVFGDGKFTVLNEPSVFKINMIGTTTFDKGKMGIKSAILLDFPINDNLMEKFADQVIESPDIAPVEVDNNGMYAKALREIGGFENAEKALEDINIKGELRKGYDEFKKALFIADVTLNWNPISLSYVSSGKIGIGNIFNKFVFKYVEGKIEIKKTNNGDIISVFLQTDETTFFYFTYNSKKGLANVYFSTESFNTTIDEMKADKKIVKAKGEKDFEYTTTTKNKAIAFRNME